MKYFADTSFLFAIFDRNENKHSVAKTVLTKLAEQGHRIYLSDFIFDEILTLTRVKVKTCIIKFKRKKCTKPVWCSTDRRGIVKTCFFLELTKG